MRVTNNMITSNTKSNINANKVLVDKYNTQMTTQKKINKPSDDPVIAIRSLRMQTSLSHIDQYLNNNISDANSWLNVTDTALENMKTILTDIRSLCVKGATDTLKEDDRRTILNQLKSLSDQIYAEGNADFSGRTVFTGYRTTEQLTFKTDEETTSYTIDQKLSYKDISEARYTYGNVDVPTDAANSFNETISIGENTYDRLRLAYGKINGKDMEDDIFSKYVFDICKIADNSAIQLTEFEILTVVMFKYFCDENVDIAVLETGLGGRFDATNVIKSNLCSIITHIDLDHTDRLGDTKDKIAYEKAGIIKPNCPVITSEGYEAIKDKADSCNSLFVMVQPFEDTSELALKGSYQQENLSLALAAIRLLFPDISHEVISEGLRRVEHPCRFQFFEDKMLLVDGAHNPNGALALRESLDRYFPDKTRRYVFGCLTTKDYPKMMKFLFTKNDQIYFYHFNNKNSATVAQLKEACEYPSNEFISLSEFPSDKDVLTVVCGSFYMINEILLK